MLVRAHLTRLPLVPRFPQRGHSNWSVRRCRFDSGVHHLAVLANRVPFLERPRMERNIAAALLLCLFALIPILRFMRSPAICWLMPGLVA